MRKIKVYIAASLDGFIARPDGNLEWLNNFPNPSGSDHGYNNLLKSVDTIIMGGKTYRALLDMGILWPYNDKKTYVVSRSSIQTSDNIEFITENIVETICTIKNSQGKDIWLVGGGELITLLLDGSLVDELQISHIPLILGDGIPLFAGIPKESKWELIGNTVYDSGIIKVDYKLVSQLT